VTGFFNPRAWTLSIKRRLSVDGNTYALFVEANRLRAVSPLADKSALDFGEEMLTELLESYTIDFSGPIMGALIEFFEDVYYAECLAPAPSEELDKAEGSRDNIILREHLRRQQFFFSDYKTQMTELKSYLIGVASFLLQTVPGHTIAYDQALSLFSSPYSAFIDNLPEVLDRIIKGSFTQDLQDLGLLANIQERFEKNIMEVSKIDPNNPPSNIHKYTLPSQTKDIRSIDLVDRYCADTPFHKFLNTKLPLVISDQSRMEHSYILAGSGHGKTQLMQQFIALDLALATQKSHSIVVMDSQGDLISKIARIDMFNPNLKGTGDLGGILADKLVIIDPNDVDFPAAINMFAMNEERMASYGSAEREKVQNSAIELYEHFFSELLGAELTARQGMVFKYLARLMLEIPDATIITLRDLMDDAKPFIPYMDKLTGSARVFFAREFFHPSFNATKKQISKRLWGVLSTPAFERLFSSPESKIDLFQLLNDGHVILINTAKDLLKESGASLYGRFFISMLTQAIMERSVIPEDERTPTFIYIDECQDYFDANVELLLAQGRKYKTGLSMAHQHMDQLTVSERASVLANSSIKLAGGVNAKDAKILANEMGCKPEFLQSMYKADDNSETEFALWVRNNIREAVKVKVPIGMLEKLPSMSDAAFERVCETNRKLYGWEYAEQDTVLDITFPGYERPEPDETAISETGADPIRETEPAEGKRRGNNQDEDSSTSTDANIEASAQRQSKTPGRGGSIHVETQAHLKSIAHHFGWRAETEHPVADGFVDVWLSREGRSIACEVTVTTANAYEIQNIDKCLNAGADEVWLISDNSEKLAQIKQAMGHKPKVWFFAPGAVEAELRARTPITEPDVKIIRGYRAEVVTAYLPDDEREIRAERLDYILSKVNV